MKLVCPNEDCKKNVDINSSSRFRIFECEACGFMFRGIHARVNRFDFYFRPRWWLFVPKWWIPDLSYNHPITATPCPHCWSKLTVIPANSDPPDSHCPDNCWSCHHPLPKSRVDLFNEDFVTEKICEFIVKNPDLFPVEETPPDPPTATTPPKPPKPPKTPKPKPPKARSKSSAPKNPPADLTKEVAHTKIEATEGQNVVGFSTYFLQSEINTIRDILKSKDPHFNDLFSKFQDNLNGKITMRTAFDMVRSISNYQHLMGMDYHHLLKLLVEDFQESCKEKDCDGRKFGRHVL